MSENQPKYELAKESWGPGPWQDEADEVAFNHAGLACQISRNFAGCYCGYVGVSPEHPIYGKSYDEQDVEELAVHGGLTFAGERGPTTLWWFGFDCAHAGDYNPGLAAMMHKHGESVPSFFDEGIYRDLTYVTSEVKALAQSLRMLMD